jgi:hypothetical protein
MVAMKCGDTLVDVDAHDLAFNIGMKLTRLLVRESMRRAAECGSERVTVDDVETAFREFNWHLLHDAMGVATHGKQRPDAHAA